MKYFQIELKTKIIPERQQSQIDPLINPGLNSKPDNLWASKQLQITY